MSTVRTFKCDCCGYEYTEARWGDGAQLGWMQLKGGQWQEDEGKVITDPEFCSACSSKIKEVILLKVEEIRNVNSMDQ